MRKRSAWGLESVLRDLLAGLGFPGYPRLKMLPTYFGELDCHKYAYTYYCRCQNHQEKLEASIHSAAETVVVCIPPVIPLGTNLKLALGNLPNVMGRQLGLGLSQVRVQLVSSHQEKLVPTRTLIPCTCTNGTWIVVLFVSLGTCS